MITRVLNFSKSIFVPCDLQMGYNSFKCSYTNENYIQIFEGKTKPNRVIIATDLTDSDSITNTLIASTVVRQSCPNTNIELLAPYIPYSYSGTPSFYNSKNFATPIMSVINHVGFDNVHVMSPYRPLFDVPRTSPLDYVRNINVLSDQKFVENSIKLIKQFYGDDIALISSNPDVDMRVYRLSAKLDIPEIKPIEPDDFNVLAEKKYTIQNCIIISDVCYSGKYLTNIASTLKLNGVQYVHLVSTHAMFTLGVTYLLKNGFNTIHTTDSCYNAITKRGPHSGVYIHHLAETTNIFDDDQHLDDLNYQRHD